MWYKPAEALANPGVIPVPKVAQDHFFDFEGEFTIVTSKAAKDVSVKAGDLVSIVHVHDDGWTEVLLASGERGLCPSTCVGAA